MERRNCHYICEREWFRKQYEKEIGKPPREKDMNMTDVVKELKAKARQRNFFAKGIVDKTDLKSSATTLKWTSTPAKKCSCPTKRCICGGSSRIKPPNTIMQGTKDNRRTCVGRMKKLIWWRRSYPPVPARTFIPRFLAAANMDALLSTASMHKRSFSELEPEYCMSGCMHFYLGQKLLRSKLYPEEDVDQIKENDEEEDETSYKGYKGNVLMNSPLSEIVIVKDPPGFKTAILDDVYHAEIDQVEPHVEKHYVEVVDDNHYSVSVQTRFDFMGNYKEMQDDKIMYPIKSLHLVKDILGCPLEVAKFDICRDAEEKQKRNGLASIFYVSTGAVREKHMKKMVSSIGRSTMSTGTLCSMGADTYQNWCSRRVVTGEDLLQLKYPARSSLGTETIRPTLSEKSTPSTTRKSILRSGAASRVSFSLVDTTINESKDSKDQLDQVMRRGYSETDVQTVNTADREINCKLSADVGLTKTDDLPARSKRPTTINMVTSTTSLKSFTRGKTISLEDDPDVTSSRLSKILQSNIRIYSGLRDNFSKIGKDMFSLFSDVLVKYSDQNINRFNSTSKELPRLKEQSRPSFHNRFSVLKIIDSFDDVDSKMTSTKTSGFSLCKLISSVAKTADKQDTYGNKTNERKSRHILENQYNMTVLKTGFPNLLKTGVRHAHDCQDKTSILKLHESTSTLSRSTITHKCIKKVNKKVSKQKKIRSHDKRRTVKSHVNESNKHSKYNIGTCIIMNDPFHQGQNSLVIESKHIMITKDSIKVQYDMNENLKAEVQESTKLPSTKILISNNGTKKYQTVYYRTKAPKKFSDASTDPSIDRNNVRNINVAEIHSLYKNNDISDSEDTEKLSDKHLMRTDDNEMINEKEIRSSNIDNYSEIFVNPASKISGVHDSTPDFIPVNNNMNQIQNMGTEISNTASSSTRHQYYLKYPDIIPNSKEYCRQ